MYLNCVMLYIHYKLYCMPILKLSTVYTRHLTIGICDLYVYLSWKYNFTFQWNQSWIQFFFSTTAVVRCTLYRPMWHSLSTEGQWFSMGITCQFPQLIKYLNINSTKLNFNLKVYNQGTSWSYGSWIYNYLCNQCLSPIMLRVRTPFMGRCIRYNIEW